MRPALPPKSPASNCARATTANTATATGSTTAASSAARSTAPATTTAPDSAAQSRAYSVWLSHNSQARLESIFVDDMSEACVYVMEMAKTTFREAGRGAGSHINVGSGYDVSLLELAQTVAQAAGYHGEILFDSQNPDTAPNRRLLEVCRLSNLGWEPMMDLHNGLE